MACCIGPPRARIQRLVWYRTYPEAASRCYLAVVARVWSMGVRVTFVQSGADNSRKRKQMISRWVTGAALSAAAITLVACGGGSDSTTGPGGITVLPSGAVSLSAGQSAPLTPASALKIDAGSSGSEDVLVLVDTGLTSISAKANFSIAATGIGAAGAVSAPATSLSPAPIAASRSPEVTASSQIAWGPKLDVSFGMRLNARSRARFRGGFDA